MTREELKEHCKKTVEQCEMWAIHRGEEPSGKVYEEHKSILDILEQEPCDTINRERALAPYKDLNDDDVISVWLIKKNITELPPVTPSRPIECDNAISQEDVLDALFDYWYKQKQVGCSGEDIYNECASIIKQLPSVTPKRRKGHWEFYGRLLKCSKCGKIWDDMEKECPKCGVEMENDDNADSWL